MVFGHIFSKKEKVITYKFEFDSDFEINSVVSLIEEGSLEEGFKVWVWDLYYAKTLYVLSNNEISKVLKKTIEKWAEPVISGIGFPPEIGNEMGLLVLDKDLQLTKKALGTKNKDVYLLEVFQKGNNWPYIQTYQPTKGYQNRLACSVIALGQHFINESKNIAKEMSLHVLSMKKYYHETNPFTSIRSTIGAPSFAIKESMEFFNELNKELRQIEKELNLDDNEKL